MNDTIAAVATAPGVGGVGIVRVSGPKAFDIAREIGGITPKPRHAYFTPFSYKQTTIDEGVLLAFVAPFSFTGEDVVEFQGHGGTVVLDMILQACVALGARIAEPGEFTKRAFLNDKIDLAQAEAIADLVHAHTEKAARNALHSLQGEFSEKIQALLGEMIQLRKMVEAAIDFPEEEIDFLQSSTIKVDLAALHTQVSEVLSTARQGALVREGMRAVIAGKPNAGKSSLLNCLTGKQSAIVTHVAGTTRDVLSEHIHIDGLPLHIIDTAGLRHSTDLVEQEGIKRAQGEIEKADVILWIKDITDDSEQALADFMVPVKNIPVIVVYNKIDLIESDYTSNDASVFISAKKKQGVDQLKSALKKIIGYSESEGQLSARRRHVDSLQRVLQLLETAKVNLEQHCAGELLAEDLRQAQTTLSEITGEFSSDDLLGEIFSSFCIGK